MRAVSVAEDTTVKLWDLESGACVSTFHADGPRDTVALSAGGVVVIGDRLGLLHFLDLVV